jgi:hypothetical protein
VSLETVRWAPWRLSAMPRDSWSCLWRFKTGFFRELQFGSEA